MLHGPRANTDLLVQKLLLTSTKVQIRTRSARMLCWRVAHAAYVSIRQHTAAYVSIRQHTSSTNTDSLCTYGSTARWFAVHTSAYVSIRQHTLCTYGSTARWFAVHTSAYVSIRQHTSAYVSIRSAPTEAQPGGLPLDTAGLGSHASLLLVA